MKQSPFEQQVRRWTQSGLAVAAGVALLTLAYQLLFSIHIVGPSEGLVVAKKWGTAAPWTAYQLSADILAPSTSHRGIQPTAPLSTGVHFLMPFLYDVRRVRAVEIKPDQVGVRVRLHGRELDEGQVIAGPEQKGILAPIDTNGQYLLNDFAEQMIIRPAAIVPAGHVGVQVEMSSGTWLSPQARATTPDERDLAYVVGDLGQVRGVLPGTLEAGTHYVNPFKLRIIPVDVRSTLLRMSEQDRIQFPSSDGFLISLEGEVRWRIDEKEAAMAFVKFIDEGTEAHAAVEHKLILPEARAFSRIEGSKCSAAEFIDGKTRSEFQKKFSDTLAVRCREHHIIIEAARITQITVPDEIATIIRQRYKLREETQAIEAEIAAEKQQITYEQSKKLQDREKREKAIAAEMESLRTKTEQEREVGLIQARQEEQVATQKLLASEFQVRAMVERARARAEVIRKQNAAEAAGFRVSKDAFGSGEAYARYELMRRLAPSIQSILGNTEGELGSMLRDMFAGGPRTPEDAKTPEPPGDAPKQPEGGR